MKIVKGKGITVEPDPDKENTLIVLTYFDCDGEIKTFMDRIALSDPK